MGHNCGSDRSQAQELSWDSPWPGVPQTPNTQSWPPPAACPSPSAVALPWTQNCTSAAGPQVAARRERLGCWTSGVTPEWWPRGPQDSGPPRLWREQGGAQHPAAFILCSQPSRPGVPRASACPSVGPQLAFGNPVASACASQVPSTLCVRVCLCVCEGVSTQASIPAPRQSPGAWPAGRSEPDHRTCPAQHLWGSV